MVLCGPVTLPPRHCGSISKVSLANLEAVWGSYWAQDTHSVFNLLLYLSLGFIPYTSSLSFLFLFFFKSLWVPRFTSSTHRLNPRGPWQSKIEDRTKMKKKKEEDVPRIRDWCAYGLLRSARRCPWSFPACALFLPCLFQSYTHYLIHAAGSVYDH